MHNVFPSLDNTSFFCEILSVIACFNEISIVFSTSLTLSPTFTKHPPFIRQLVLFSTQLITLSNKGSVITNSTLRKSAAFEKWI
jgi:hypothetical protein